MKVVFCCKQTFTYCVNILFMRKRKKNKKNKSKLKTFLIGLVAVFMAFGFIFAGIFLLWASTLTMPTVDIIEKQRSEQSTKIYDRTGEILLYDMHKDIRRTVVPLDEISDYLKNATISIEDSGFYKHHGIEPLAILRAVIRNLQKGDLFGGQGGSTITQQVVKNTVLVREKKLSRKLKEWVLAIKLEQDLSKDEILELYLNEVPYGGTKYGIEEASQGFFGKHAKDLTLVESAYLAALPQAPTYYSPYGNHREALDARKNEVLRRMNELGYISEEEYKKSLNEAVEFQPFSSASIKAPHFVFYVIDQISKMYGYDDISKENLKIITTLDWELQQEAEKIVHKHAIENTEKFNATNASLMAIDPKTGDILVMVGSRDYFDDEVDGNFNIGLAKRQPGSSFKPFAYAAALKKGYTTETVVYDSRTQFSTACKKTNLTSEGDCYSPQNYDHKFRGPMTFREALAQSVNVPAVKALYLAGMKNTIELAKDMGISTLDNWQRYGLTLVLGGGEVSLLDITSAYGVFANEGYRYPYTGIKEILSDKQQNIYTKKENGKRVLDVNIARSISDMLSDNTARTPAFGSNSYLYFKDYDVAVKTGTTNDYRDAWIIGYTPNISVGAWAGNNNNSAMKKKVAGFIVAPMWNEFMNFYFKKHPDSPDFTEPEPLDPELKPILIGQKPFGNNIFNKSTTTSTSTISVHSILYWVDKDNPLGEKPLNPSLDPQYDYWEYGVLLWSVTHKNISISDILNNKNNSTNNINKPDVIIKRPKDKKTYDKNDTIRVSFDVSDEENIFRTEYYIDGIPVKNKNGTNGKFSFKPTDYDLKEGEHTLLILVYTKNNTRGGSSVDFRVR